MPYLIDGHNLVPKVGLRLDSPDDEMQLAALLQQFARVTRREVHVYFDGAPAGQARTKRLGMLTAHFVRIGSSADEAIKAHVRRLGAAARNWVVVTSDRMVQNEARAAHARIISSEEFAGQLKQMQKTSERPNGEQELSDEEVQEWLRLFGGKK